MGNSTQYTNWWSNKAEYIIYGLSFLFRMTYTKHKQNVSEINEFIHCMCAFGKRILRFPRPACASHVLRLPFLSFLFFFLFLAPLHRSHEHTFRHVNNIINGVHALCHHQFQGQLQCSFTDQIEQFINNLIGKYQLNFTITHSQCDGHSIGISVEGKGQNSNLQERAFTHIYTQIKLK